MKARETRAGAKGELRAVSGKAVKDKGGARAKKNKRLQQDL